MCAFWHKFIGDSVVMVMQSRQQNQILQERFPVFAAQAKVCAENVTPANNISVR
jgi:hypothetical protein